MVEGVQQGPVLVGTLFISLPTCLLQGRGGQKL